MVVFHVIAALSMCIFLLGVGRRARGWLVVRPSGDAREPLAGRLLRLARRTPEMARWKVLGAVLADGFLLRRMWRASRLRWAIHVGIAWSFLGLFFIGSLGNFVSDLGAPLEKDDAWFAVLNDALGATLLGGVLLALGRRSVSRHPYVRTGASDVLALAALGILAVGGFLVEATRYLDEGTPASTGGYAFIGYPLARVADGLGWKWGAVYDVAWWSHALVALGLVAYLPYSKLVHTMTSPASIAVAAATPHAGHPAPSPLPVRPEGGPAVGNLSLRQMLELDACTRCGECLRVCGSFAATGNEVSAVMGMFAMRRRLSASVGAREGQPGFRGWEMYEQGVFSCTLCGHCEEVCPVGIRTRGLALTLREELATFRCMMPKNLGVARDAVMTERNVFNFPNEDRALWAEFMDGLPDDILTKQKAEVVYYVGCVSSFSPAVQEVPQAFLRVLLNAGVDVALLGGSEWCCGFPLIVGGLAADARELMDHNIEEIRRLGAKKVVFNCPSCFYTWKKYYQLDGIELQHSTQFIRDLVGAGRLVLDSGGLAVSYHDPCDLGRGSGEYEAPRVVLRRMAGSNFIELKDSREQSLCCGGGGDVEMWDPDLVGHVNDLLTRAVDESGVALLVQACPQCKRTTQRGLAANCSSVRTVDITEAALEFGTFIDSRPQSREQV